MLIKRMSGVFGVVLGLCVLAPATAGAQPAPEPGVRRAEGRGGMWIERVEQAMDELGLSEQQKAQVREILDKAREDFRAAMQEMQGLDPQEIRQRMREMRDDLVQQISGVLDEDQKAEFQQRLEELRARFGRGGGQAQDQQPATQPAARIGAVIEQLRDALGQLQLSEDQKAQAESIIRETRDKLRELRDEAAGDIEKIRTKAREILNDTRQELQEILTPEQQQKLRELMEAMTGPRGQRGANVDRPRRGAADRDAAPQPPAMDDQNKDKPATDPTDGPRSALPPPVNVQSGQVASDFALTKLDGRPVQLSSFKGRVLVLLFGNYTSPSFRERVADYEQLRRQFANRAEFLIIYTRESHPVGQWEVDRNKKNKIAIEQPKSLDERKAVAQQAKQALRITIPIAIDTMDDRTARDYDGFTAAAVVIGRDGKIVGHLKWGDPFALRRMIDDALKTRAAPATQPRES